MTAMAQAAVRHGLAKVGNPPQPGPIPRAAMNGGCGASSPIRRAVSHRLQSADCRPSRPFPGTGRFEVRPEAAIRLSHSMTSSAGEDQWNREAERLRGLQIDNQLGRSR
jgi:hypothetical protein